MTGAYSQRIIFYLFLLQILLPSLNNHAGILPMANAIPLTGSTLALPITSRQENVTVERPENLRWECGWKDHDRLDCQGLGEWSGEDRVFRRCEVILESGGVRNICEGYRICYVQNNIRTVCSEWPQDYCRVPEEIFITEKVRRVVGFSEDWGNRGALASRAIAADVCKVYTRGKRP
ncbi:hypothetical protein V8F20_011669 [Naviculisporaceae sp. PSN 640]